jgi:hypothetical protein
MPTIRDWRGAEVEVAHSAGGVIAVVDPWANTVRGGVSPWPPPELIQKAYQSRQVRSFRDAHAAAAIRALGYYTDLQSLHSEDALTWSVFGTVAYAAPSIRTAFVAELLRLIDIPHEEPVLDANIWLWRRLPHPDTLVPGGPEVDFGIQTADVFLLGEAKWLSPVGALQGVAGDKDQLALRREFCEKYGRGVLPGCRRFVVLAVSRAGGVLPETNAEVAGVSVHARDATWERVVALSSHPSADELRVYLVWKLLNSRVA